MCRAHQDQAKGSAIPFLVVPFPCIQTLLVPVGVWMCLRVSQCCSFPSSQASFWGLALPRTNHRMLLFHQHQTTSPFNPLAEAT